MSSLSSSRPVRMRSKIGMNEYSKQRKKTILFDWNRNFLTIIDFRSYYISFHSFPYPQPIPNFIHWFWWIDWTNFDNNYVFLIKRQTQFHWTGTLFRSKKKSTAMNGPEAFTTHRATHDEIRFRMSFYRSTKEMTN